jgi:predicted nucleic acid-binding protein
MGRRALLDTSVLIAKAGETAPPAPPPGVDELAVSVVTLAELEFGVLRRALDPDTRAGQLATLTYVRETYEALDINPRVAHEFAGIAAALRDAGRAIRVNDAWIAATALAHDAALISSDRDFESIPRLETVIVNS